MDFFHQDRSGILLMVWRLSLVSFMLAALTGFFYKMGLLVNPPAAIELANLRHAHSHLTFSTGFVRP